ncbi:MAG TPA: hypothetical protein VGO35_02145 [Gammaproteobacteria bacterium]|jgi:hypothetical protein|nr:hypothetical protein [Gammaproteobacteria bacterium]
MSPTDQSIRSIFLGFVLAFLITQALAAAPEPNQARDAAVLNFINTAQQIYVFANTNPRYPHRDDKHMRPLDAKARDALVAAIGSQEDWWQGLYDMGVEDAPATDVGFVFKTGKDELALFFLEDSLASGDLIGESFKGLLNEGASKKLKAWSAKYAPAELAVPRVVPPASTDVTHPNFKMVGDIMVSGDFNLVTDTDVRVALAALKDAGLGRVPGILVMGKDEIRGYLQSDEWMTARSHDCTAADPSQVACWSVPRLQLPGYSEALHCIQEAKYVHIFPVASPLKHYRDFDHSMMLDDTARQDLVVLLGARQSWLVSDDSMPLPGRLPADFGFDIIDGKDDVHLFFSSNGKVQGDFNGEYLSGALTESTAQALQTWKVKYDRPGHETEN